VAKKSRVTHLLDGESDEEQHQSREDLVIELSDESGNNLTMLSFTAGYVLPEDWPNTRSPHVGLRVSLRELRLKDKWEELLIIAFATERGQTVLQGQPDFLHTNAFHSQENLTNVSVPK